MGITRLKPLCFLLGVGVGLTHINTANDGNHQAIELGCAILTKYLRLAITLLHTGTCAHMWMHTPSHTHIHTHWETLSVFGRTRKPRIELSWAWSLLCWFSSKLTSYMLHRLTSLFITNDITYAPWWQQCPFLRSPMLIRSPWIRNPISPTSLHPVLAKDHFFPFTWKSKNAGDKRQHLSQSLSGVNNSFTY
jgi:hypothetical protein